MNRIVRVMGKGQVLRVDEEFISEGEMWSWFNLMKDSGKESVLSMGKYDNGRLPVKRDEEVVGFFEKQITLWLFFLTGRRDFEKNDIEWLYKRLQILTQSYQNETRKEKTNGTMGKSRRRLKSTLRLS